MKFLCDSCKAKYQISDDKVAGKTVRMKCRKCGHQIEVRAAVTETSVSVAPPRPDAPGPGPGGATAPKRPGLATSLSTARPPTQKMNRPETGALAGAFNKSVKDEQVAAAQYGGHGGHAPLSSKPYSSQPPSNLDSLDVSMTEEWYVAINGVPVGPIRVSELRRKAAGGAIHDDSLCWQEGLEEWRPLKAIPELARIVREAAMSGRPSLTAHSERPSQTPPPPQAGTGTLVPGSHSHGAASHQQHASHQGAQPQAPRAPARPATSGPLGPMSPMNPMGAPQGGVPRPLQTGAPMQAAAHAPMQSLQGSPFGASPLAPAARNNVVPISGGRLATAERLEDPVPAAMLFAPPPPAQTPAPPMASAAPIVAVDPFSPTSPAQPSPFSNMMMPGVAGGGMHAQTNPGQMVAPASPSFAPPVQQKRGAPLWAIAAIVFAGCFGIAVAVMVFMPKPAPAQPIAAQTGTAPVAQPSSDPSAASLAVAPPASAASDPSASTAGTTKIGSGPKSTGPVAVAGPATTHTGADLKNLLGTGPGGPSDGPGPGGGAAGGAGGGLDGKAVEGVVAARRAGIKRKCWDTGNLDQKASANVQVAVTVAPGGSVTNAIATGDEPVAACIAREVKGWNFPAPGSTTTVNIPFHFVRQ